MGQPYLHQHVTCLSAPTTWLSPPDAQVRGGVAGLYLADLRILSRLEVRVDGAEPEPVSAGNLDAGRARFLGVLRGLGDCGPDPTVWCERTRTAGPDGGEEAIELRNASRGTLQVELSVTVGADFAPVMAVKHDGTGLAPAPAQASPDGLSWGGTTADGPRVLLRADPPPAVDLAGQVLRWSVVVPPGQAWRGRVALAAHRPPSPGFRPVPPGTAPAWHAAPLRVRAGDRRLDALVAASMSDLAALRLADPDEPADAYPAAGSPWYLTLFGRDTLWVSTLALPLGPELAGGTLRALARRQGSRVDPETEEAPGKIPHELRPANAAVGLPAVYFGTVDASPLFVVLLAQAWRWGLPAAEVAALLPAARAALAWLTTHGDPDGDGFIKYLPAGHGLVNQGWKDSSDGVQHADGRLATPPVALVEVQGYAYRAAMDGAALFDAFGEPGGDRWREWAGQLAARFRDAFWVSDVDGSYPAIALEAGNKPVDGPSSNMGHLLGTGLLTPPEEALVARRLAGPALDSGYGLRTLADTAAGFNPLSYHAGSVWPHDTAIAVRNLALSGHSAPAAALLCGLLAAAPGFGYRLPELYGGQRAEPPLPPVPYPAACRPQAWAAAAGLAMVQALLGLEVDVPGGRLRLRPMAPSPVGAYSVRNIRLGYAGTLHVDVDEAGQVVRVEAPAPLRVEVAGSEQP
ncbi:MAG TPA: glycogen debranching N-terminal domain-containing protein [Micromonosporaceae bacterium]|nr:glycogen debranching N-terminal domain-containing protein [Micromonosporaceae bacterium]